MTEKSKKYGSDFIKIDKHEIQCEEFDEAPELTDEALDRATFFDSNMDIAIHVPRIRAKTNMTQKDFAATFGFPLSTLRKWEQGRRTPTGAAISLLTIIDHNPDIALQALERSHQS